MEARAVSTLGNGSRDYRPGGERNYKMRAVNTGTQPKVFAVIINWNGEKDTVMCLESLLELKYENCHVVISDNGSRKESLDSIKHWFSEKLGAQSGAGGIASYTILENGRNLGFTGANTAGIHYAMNQGADYILFLNNDTIVTPQFLSKMVAAAESSPAIGIAGCKIFYADVEPNGRHKLWSLGGYSFRGGMPINIAGGQYDRPEWVGVQPQPLINGCCMLIKRAVIESIGVQSDELFFGIDDVEYSFRASRRGWTNVVAYDAVIYHAASQSVVPRSGLQVYYLFRNILLFRARAFSVRQNLWFFTVFVIRYVLLGSGYRWLRGRRKVNLGVFYALKDFKSGQTGECQHVAALRA